MSKSGHSHGSSRIRFLILEVSYQSSHWARSTPHLAEFEQKNAARPSSSVQPVSSVSPVSSATHSASSLLAPAPSHKPERAPSIVTTVPGWSSRAPPPRSMRERLAARHGSWKERIDIAISTTGQGRRPGSPSPPAEGEPGFQRWLSRHSSHMSTFSSRSPLPRPGLEQQDCTLCHESSQPVRRPPRTPERVRLYVHTG